MESVSSDSTRLASSAIWVAPSQCSRPLAAEHGATSANFARSGPPSGNPDHRMKLEAVVPVLRRLGFRKRAGHIFTMDLAPGVLGWLGLNRATRHRARGEVEVNPVVGVRFQEIERVVQECRSAKFHPYVPPTTSSPLGYLMPERRYKAWIFVEGSGERSVAEDMGAAIDAYGVPFMRSVADLRSLRRRMDERSGFEHQNAYCRPVAALLAGDATEAGARLDEELEALGTRSDPAATDFRSFASALRKRL